MAYHFYSFLSIFFLSLSFYLSLLFFFYFHFHSIHVNLSRLDIFYRSSTLLRSFLLALDSFRSNERERTLSRCPFFYFVAGMYRQITKAGRIFCFEYLVRWRDTMCQETFYCIFAKQAVPLLLSISSRKCLTDFAFATSRTITRMKYKDDIHARRRELFVIN